MTIGEKLRELRGERTLREVGAALGVGKSTISMWEHDLHMPKDELKAKIAEYYGVKLSDIFEDEPVETTETTEVAEADTHLDECVMPIREYKGQRVVTLADIDRVHKRPEGTAGRNFRINRKRFVEGEDMFTVGASEFRRAFGEQSMDLRQQNNVILLTESGYLMVVKSLTDDLAWRVQRMLVNNYFRAKNQKTSAEWEDMARYILNKKAGGKKLSVIIRCMQKAGFDIPNYEDLPTASPEQAEAFAALVASIAESKQNLLEATR